MAIINLQLEETWENPVENIQTIPVPMWFAIEKNMEKLFADIDEKEKISASIKK
jgi:hypothetical protein